jgi:rod shape-determining protein MreB
MLKQLRGVFSQDLAVDIGTVTTRIFARAQGIALAEPSIAAARPGSGPVERKDIVAVGLKAVDMLDRNPGNLKALRPLQAGVIADLNATEELLQAFFRRVHGRTLFRPSPRVLICVPCGSTPLERRAMRESALRAGARKVYLVEEPLAAAIGAGVPLADASGSMVVHLGGGISEVAVVCLNGIVHYTSARVGGTDLDTAIVNYTRRHYGMQIEEPSPTQIKHAIGCASQASEARSVEVRGHRVKDGKPGSFTLTSDEILSVFKDPLADLSAMIKKTLGVIEPELASDIAGRGIILAGGGACLRNLDLLLADQTDLNVLCAEDPADSAVRGAGKLLELVDGQAIETFAVG